MWASDFHTTKTWSQEKKGWEPLCYRMLKNLAIFNFRDIMLFMSLFSLMVSSWRISVFITFLIQSILKLSTYHWKFQMHLSNASFFFFLYSYCEIVCYTLLCCHRKRIVLEFWTYWCYLVLMLCHELLFLCNLSNLHPVSIWLLLKQSSL